MTAITKEASDAKNIKLKVADERARLVTARGFLFCL